MSLLRTVLEVLDHVTGQKKKKKTDWKGRSLFILYTVFADMIIYVKNHIEYKYKMLLE